jgi:hypothetical protein
VAILTGVATAIWVLKVGMRSPRVLGSSVLVLLLLTAVAGERMLFVRAERGLGSGLGTYEEQMRIDPAMAFIAGRSNPGLHRTLAAGTTSNRMLVAGLDETGGYQSTYPRTYHALFGGLTDPYLRTDPDRYRYFHGWGNRAAVFGPGLDSELLDLMGVRWVYADRMDLDAPGLTPVFRSGPITVYENASVFPRAFVVSRLRPFESTEALLEGLVESDRDELLSTGFVLAQGLSGPVPDDSGDPEEGDPEDSATITEYAPDRVEIQATSGSGGYLVLTDTAAPGWRASVDGVDTPILTVDLAYRAVAVPSGSSTVTFTYRPWFTYVGLVSSAGAVVLLVLWGLLGTTFVSRRRGGERSSAVQRG